VLDVRFQAGDFAPAYQCGAPATFFALSSDVIDHCLDGGEHADYGLSGPRKPLPDDLLEKSP